MNLSPADRAWILATLRRNLAMLRTKIRDDTEETLGRVLASEAQLAVLQAMQHEARPES